MATRSLRVPTSIVALLVACSPGGGLDGTSTSTDVGSTSGATMSGASTDEASSTGEPGSTGAVGVCGDGVLDPGEHCDPPGDGCTAACQYIDRTVWTVTRGSRETPAWIHEVAVDPAGRVVVLGATQSDTGFTRWLLALDADGDELWAATLSSDVVFDELAPHIAVDADGIYVQARGVYGFTPEGAPMWSTQPVDRIFTALAVADGAVYAVGSVYDEQGGNLENQHLRLVVDRIDAATGAVAWDRILGDDAVESVAAEVAVTGDTVFVVGAWSMEFGSRTGFIAVDAATGTSGQPVFDEGLSYVVGLDTLPMGDLVLAGRGSESMLARRFSVDGEIRWTAGIDLLAADLGALAVAPDERVVLVGTISTATGPHGYLRGLSGAGESAWTLFYAPADPANGVAVGIAAFGPDFFVAGGQEYRHADGGGTAWIRRIEIDGAMP